VLQETKAAYEAMMNTVHGIFGDQPADVLRGAVDEVLDVLKNQNKTGTLPTAANTRQTRWAAAGQRPLLLWHRASSQLSHFSSISHPRGCCCLSC
jgi:hypothetical protein